MQRVKKTKVKTTRALLRWNLRVSGLVWLAYTIYIYRHDCGAPRSVYQSWWKQRILWKPCVERNTVRGLGILNLYMHEIDSFHLWSCRNPIQNPAPTLREYPKGLGKSLVKIYRELNVSEKPLACLRQKADFSYSSDLKLFQEMPMGDTWPDACLKEVYLYLWNSKSTRVPKEWATTLVSFTRSLREATCQQYGISPKETWKSGGGRIKY